MSDLVECCVTVLMDSNKCSTQLERLGVIETGRRRRWADEEKLKIVAESMETPRAISSTARRYGISRSLLLNWRRSFCTEPDGAEGQRSGFVRAMVVADPARSARAAPASGRCLSSIPYPPAIQMRVRAAHVAPVRSTNKANDRFWPI